MINDERLEQMQGYSIDIARYMAVKERKYDIADLCKAALEMIDGCADDEEIDDVNAEVMAVANSFTILLYQICKAFGKDAITVSGGDDIKVTFNAALAEMFAKHGGMDDDEVLKT